MSLVSYEIGEHFSSDFLLMPKLYQK